MTLETSNDAVCALTRVRPGQRHEPVVVHLVDWSDDPRAFSVQLDPLTLFGGIPYVVRLVEPLPYSPALHAAAERSGDFSILKKE
ncbi:MAG: hypothetical protein ACOC0M_10590, partial [Halomonas sp.]